MKLPSKLFLIVFVLLLGFQAYAKTIKVSTISDLQQAVNSARPGDRIILASGIYQTSGPLIIKSSGNEKQPVSIEAEITGKTEISGLDGFHIEAPTSYTIIKGFLFTHKSGTFRIDPGVTHCTITRNIFECVPNGTKGSKPYISVSGDDNEISYNIFQNKKDEGQMISVQGPGTDKMAKRVWIHHNYFNNFPSTGLNNCSAIQIGLSGRSMDSAFCVVEYNLFERTEGENEGAICHKSCKNIIRFNTFGEKSEECSIRHGNGSLVYGNFFINTTGLRFSGDDHLIYANYFSGCSKAIVCQNGDGEVKEGSKLTCHDRADRVEIAGNTIVDCKETYQMPSRNNGLGATNISFTGNIIYGGAPVSVRGSYPGAVWKDNLIWKTTGGDMPESGFSMKEITPEKNGRSGIISNGKYPEIPASNRPLTINDVGPEAR
jgi:poly(beta-D-mannuronate) lyase